MITISLLFIFLNFIESENSIVKWQERPQVVWSDFQGKPDLNSPFDAQVYSGMQYAMSYHEHDGIMKLDIDVHAFFNPTMSWSKKEKRSDYLLRHEQLHFDISELYARKLKKELEQFEFESSKNPSKEIEHIFERLNKERKEMQKKYDQETDHSKNSASQLKWDKKISEALKSAR